MIPFALPELYADRMQRDPAKGGVEFWFIFKDSNLLVDEESMLPFQTKNLPLVRSLYMGTFGELHLHVGEMDAKPPGAIWVDLKMLFGKIDEALFALAGRAVQLAAWNRTNQFCGQCGNRTTEKLNERAKECKSCNLLFFPRISPAVMALIQREDQILLARGPHFPKGVYSVLAGFVDPGETLEQCVQREVFEEVGLQVDEICYFGSQSWPFPNSLMVAFTCQWVSGEIRMDRSEIEDAQWFAKDRLPLLPPEISISRFLINATLETLQSASLPL